jgi:hypothetical protein
VPLASSFSRFLERTLFTLDWISDPALRRRTNAGLNKGEARNALARAVFFHRLGEIRDRTFENQRYRASGLNLAVAAIILWNTVYLGLAVGELLAISHRSDGSISPLYGDYVWPVEPLATAFRPLRNPRAETPLSVLFREDSAMTPTTAAPAIIRCSCSTNSAIWNAAPCVGPTYLPNRYIHGIVSKIVENIGAHQ